MVDLGDFFCGNCLKLGSIFYVQKEVNSQEFFNGEVLLSQLPS